MSEEATEKKTLGEELFLVHLSRQTHTLPTADDFDHEDRKQRDTDRRPSIGEELWHVHCKRAVGTIMDEDLDEDDNLKAPAKKSATKKQVQKVFQEPHEGAQAKVDDKVIHHLRNRDVTIE
jgi:hypothetical protein